VGKPTDPKYGGILTDEEIAMESRAWRDQVVWLRNHPSIFLWLTGSDLEPKPEAEKRYLAVLKEYDSTRVCIGSAKSTTTLAGPSGVKMEGPYAYVPPVYWFSDSIKGGAFGFATEIGPGAQVPPAQSIKKMLSEDHWWPIDEMWDFHCGRGKFGNLDRYRTALEKRYGKVTDFADFEKKAQLLNYELMRPMFEAYSVHRYKATGLILWMLNSAWPEMYWQLYDYYLNPNGAYYGAKTALRPYHVVYDYYKKTLFTVNDRLEDVSDYKLKVRIYDVQSNLKYEKEMKVDLKANSAQKVLPLDKVNIAGVYFIDTRLYDDGGEEVDRNFYWISPKEDLLDYNDPNTPSWVHTASKQYADFTEINVMPKVEVKASMTETKGDEETRFEVILANKSPKIAFFIHSDIVDQQTGETILPVRWSDNYVSLLPGEKRILTALIRNNCLVNKKPQLVVTGYNLK
jgi:exo-1,4-beta-D-glucosaminidase